MLTKTEIEAALAVLPTNWVDCDMMRVRALRDLLAAREDAGRLANDLELALREHDASRSIIKWATDAERDGDYAVPDRPWATQARASLTAHNRMFFPAAHEALGGGDE